MLSKIDSISGDGPSMLLIYRQMNNQDAVDLFTNAADKVIYKIEFQII